MADRESARPANGRAAAGDGFFSGGGRNTHLEQLRHLNQWSRRVLLVTGAPGAGKSVLYRQFSATLEPRAKAARIDTSLAKGPRALLGAMVQGFGLAAPADAGTDLLSELVGAHALEQERTDRYCVVLVDDAEALETRALDVLVKLAAGSPLRVVLFGGIKLVPAVERVAHLHGASWHEIRLGGFDPADVRAFLEWWFRRQGHRDALPLTDAQVREITRLSEGLPGRVEQMARVLLAKIQSQGDEGRRRFPVLHQALLAVLVAVVAVVYVTWPAGEEGDGAVDVETVDVPPLQNVDVAPEPDVATAPDVTRQPEVTPAPEVVPEPDVAAERADEPEAPGPQEVGPQEAGPQEAAPLERAPPEPAPETPVTPPEIAVPTAEPEAEPPLPAETPPAPASGPRDASWIMSQPETAYTLQLVSFSTDERANAYLARQAQPEDFARFRQQSDGRILHVVIYGRFDSRAAAERAAADLPGSIGRVQPWIRSFAAVQDAVRTALQR